MTTARDVITAKLKEWFSFAGERMDWEWEQYAYVLEKALIDAPESVRLELAWQLLPKGFAVEWLPAPPSEESVLVAPTSDA